MKLLINVKVDVNLSNGIEILLIKVSCNGYLDIVKELLKVGVVINLRGIKCMLLGVVCD